MNEKRIVKGFLTIGSGALINIVISFLCTPIITRLVDPAQYGQWSMFRMYSSVAVMVLCLGMDQSLIRFFYKDDTIEYKRALTSVCYSFSLVCSAGLCGTIVTLRLFGLIKADFDNLNFTLLIINTGVSILLRYANILLRLSNENTKYTLSSIIMRASFTVMAIVLIRHNDKSHFLLLCIATTVSAAISCLYSFLYTSKYWFGTKRFSGIDRKELFRYGLPFIISMGITTLFEAIDRLSLKYYCTYEVVGIYTSAIQIVNVFAVIQTAFNAIWSPLQVNYYSSHPNDTSFFSKANSIITVIMISFGALFIFLKDIVVVLLGQKYREAVAFLPFLAFHPIMYTISETTNTGIEKAGKSYLYIIVGAVSCIANFIGNTALVPQLGGKGAAISTGISYVVFWGLRTFFSYTLFKVDYKIQKFLIVLILMIMYSLYSTFYSNVVLNLAGFFAIICSVLVLYRETVKELLLRGKLILERKYRNK